MHKKWAIRFAEIPKAEIFLAATIFAVYFLCLLLVPFFPCQRYDMFYGAPTMYENFYFYSDRTELRPSIFEMARVYKRDDHLPVGRVFTFEQDFKERLSLESFEAHLLGMKGRNLIPNALCIKRVTWSSRPDGSLGSTLTERYWWDGKYVSDITAKKILCAAEDL